MFFKRTQCKCGKVFYGEETICDECFMKTRTAVVGNCVVEDAEGRCDEYMREECDKCMKVACERNWRGWRKVRNVDSSKDSV